MKIAILGNGAMASLFGSYLSLKNEVVMVGRDKKKIEALNKSGIIVRELGEDMHFDRVKSAVYGEYSEPVDLIIIFVKGYATEESLEKNRSLIGKDTYVLSLQNGAGHRKQMEGFVDGEHLLIGTTVQGATLIGLGVVNHGNSGVTSFGRINGDTSGLDKIEQVFEEAGFPTIVSSDPKYTIWKKLLNNSSISTATAILQCPLEYLSANRWAWEIVEGLLKESIAVAEASGFYFDFISIRDELREVCDNSHNAYTSIYTDTKMGRKSEVDFISGFVASEGERLYVDVPMQKMAVKLIHALEEKVGVIKE